MNVDCRLGAGGGAVDPATEVGARRRGAESPARVAAKRAPGWERFLGGTSGLQGGTSGPLGGTSGPLGGTSGPLGGTSVAFTTEDSRQFRRNKVSNN